MPASPPAAQARASFGQTLAAVLWGFFGVRKRRHLDRDAASLNPVHLLVMGVAIAAVFVVCLVLLVRFITR